METQEWTTIDKTAWAPGPWHDEPDKWQWVDEATGLPCLAVRASSHGGLCGYVGVGPDHPLFGIGSFEAYGLDVRVHCGITYAAPCVERADEESSICHIAPDDVERFWLGFDCAHCDDLSPATAHMHPWITRAECRTMEYVTEQCRALAAQFADIERCKKLRAERETECAESNKWVEQ